MRANGSRRWVVRVTVSVSVILGSVVMPRAQGADCDATGCIATCFQTGDANGNGSIEIADATTILGFLFLGRSGGGCLAALDADANGTIQLTDGVRILGYLFLGQSAPVCPVDPCLSGFTCDTYSPSNCTGGSLRVAEPDVRFELTGPPIVEGLPLEVVSFSVDAHIRLLASLPDVNGWSLSLVAEPSSRCAITAATTNGTDVDLFFGGGFKKTELGLAPVPGATGAVSAVVLGFTSPTTLPAVEDTHFVLALSLSGGVPEYGCAPCQIRYLDHVKGSGQPVKNHVVRGDVSYEPALQSLEVSLCAGLELLGLNEPAPSSIALSQAAPSRIYVLSPRPGPGATLLFDFSSSDPDAENAVYVRFGAIPTPALFDAASDERGQSSVRLAVPYTPDAECYVLFEAKRLRGAGHNLSGRVITADLVIERMTPTCGGGCAGSISAEVFGAGFEAGMSFWLETPGGPQILATNVAVLGGDHAQAVFDLTGQTPGRYALVAARGGVEARLETGTVIRPAGIGPKLSTEILSSPFFRDGRIKRFTVRYRNDGDEEMPAPLFVVEAPQGSELRFASEAAPLPECLPFDQRSKLCCLGIPLAGSPARLAPGAFGEIPIVLRHPSPGETLELSVKVLTPLPDDSIDWPSLPTPACAAEEQWQISRPALQAMLGPSWSSFRDGLGRIAARLSTRGRRTASVRELLRFALDSSVGLPSSSITGVVRDANGFPLSQHSVTATLGPEGLVVGCSRTDGEGAFAISSLGPGSYGLSVDGIPTAVQSVTVGEGLDARGIQLTTIGADGNRFNCPPGPEARPPVSPPDVPAAHLVEAARLELKVVRSIDPNEKEGPTEDVIRRKTDLVYTIHFENDPKATAAAERVTITDTLDERLDLSTVRFLDAQVDGREIPLDLVGATSLTSGYTESPALNRCSLTTTQGILVLYPREDRPKPLDLTVSASCDKASRTITWVLASEDVPVVGSRVEEESDAASGFLQPYDSVTGRGRGSVCFSVRLMDNAQGGSDVPNDARIVFDNGPLMATDSISNQIEPCGLIPFRRGDVSAQGGDIDISDPIAILNYLFVSPEPLECLRAADAQNDGRVDLSDAVYLLLYLFSGGDPPPAPSSCADPEAFDPGPFDCCEYASCG